MAAMRNSNIKSGGNLEHVIRTRVLHHPGLCLLRIVIRSTLAKSLFKIKLVKNETTAPNLNIDIKDILHNGTINKLTIPLIIDLLKEIAGPRVNLVSSTPKVCQKKETK